MQEQETEKSELVPVQVNRIFDSCCDRDSFQELPVQCGAELPAAGTWKVRSVRLSAVTAGVEEIPFDRGFYSVNVRFSFALEIAGEPEGRLLTGTAAASKSCILFGSQVSSQLFSGEQSPRDLPAVTVRAVEPVVLGLQPATLCAMEGHEPPKRTLLLSLGLFSVIELTRPTALLLPAYPYTIPQRSTPVSVETPTAMFERMQFPAEAFSPAALEDPLRPGRGD